MYPSRQLLPVKVISFKKTRRQSCDISFKSFRLLLANVKVSKLTGRKCGQLVKWQILFECKNNFYKHNKTLFINLTNNNENFN